MTSLQILAVQYGEGRRKGQVYLWLAELDAGIAKKKM